VTALQRWVKISLMVCYRSHATVWGTFTVTCLSDGNNASDVKLLMVNYFTFEISRQGKSVPLVAC